MDSRFVSVTELRANIYKVIDAVIEAEEPLLLKRNGRIVKISVLPLPANLKKK